MELLHFDKYQGTGNDFILVDDRKQHRDFNGKTIVKLCDRRFGIGSDGLLLLRERQGYDFEMLFFNPDGSRATFCGNGARCISAFAASLGVIQDEASFLAPDGAHKASVLSRNGNDSLVSISMIDPVIYHHSEDYTYLNSGTYHVVKFVPDPDAVEIMKAGPEIRYDGRFAPAGTNVNFARINQDSVYVRTYEKGVEAETLSCGTGVTATAIAASLRTGRTDVRVVTKGGELRVHFSRKDNNFEGVFLEGPAVKVFSGSINL
ncbi:MAG TPA: diaminopimelate epimerase [Bacteroidales bacterium]|nr:diaminopimelate epimerase [Bacteroidales bacterium]